MKLEINCQKESWKIHKIWKLENSLLSDHWVNEDIEREINIKNLEINVKDSITHQNSVDGKRF